MCKINYMRVILGGIVGQHRRGHSRLVFPCDLMGSLWVSREGTGPDLTGPDFSSRCSWFHPRLILKIWVCAAIDHASQAGVRTAAMPGCHWAVSILCRTMLSAVTSSATRRAYRTLFDPLSTFWRHHRSGRGVYAVLIRSCLSISACRFGGSTHERKQFAAIDGTHGARSPMPLSQRIRTCEMSSQTRRRRSAKDRRPELLSAQSANYTFTAGWVA